MQFGFGEVPSSEDIQLVENAKEDFLAAQADLLAAWGAARAKCGGFDYTELSPSLWSLSNKLIDRNDSGSEAVILNNWISDFQQNGYPSAANIVDRINGDIQAINGVYTQVISLTCPPAGGSAENGSSTSTTGGGSTAGGGGSGYSTTGGGGGGGGGSGNGVVPIPPKPVQAGLGSFGWLGLIALLGYIVYQKYGKKKSMTPSAIKRRSTKRTKRLKPVKRSYYPRLVGRIRRSSRS